MITIVDNNYRRVLATYFFVFILTLLPFFCWSQTNFCTVQTCSTCLQHSECIWCKGADNPYCLDNGQECTRGHETVTDADKCYPPERSIVGVVLGSITLAVIILATVAAGVVYLYYRKRQAESFSGPRYTHLPTEE